MKKKLRQKWTEKGESRKEEKKGTGREKKDQAEQGDGTGEKEN